MKNSKKISSLKGKLLAILSGMKVVQSMEPHILPITVFSAALNAFSPFINIYVTALIINELLGSKSLQHLTCLVCFTVGLNLLTFLAAKGLERLKSIYNYRLQNLATIELDRMILNTDYENLEKPDFHLHKQKIDEAWNMNSRGIWNIAPLLEKFTSSLFTVAFSISLAFPLFLPSVKENKSHPFLVSPWLSSILLAFILLSSVFSILSNASFSKIMFSQMDKIMPINRVYSFYSGLISDPKFGKDVRIYSQQNLIMKEFNVFVESCSGFFSSLGKIQGRFSGVNGAISAILGGMVYLFVGLKALIGIFSIGSVVKYVGAINQFTTGLSNLVSSATESCSNAEYVELYLNFLNTPNPKYKGTLPVEKRSDNEYEIEFKNVSFKYPGVEVYTLKNFSLKLRIGERLAVVGMNGSGKTTFIKLLCRLYDPQEGEILLNGINIQKYEYNEYLSLFSIVFQDFHLFAFSVGQNVAASVEYDKGMVMEYLEEVGAGECINKMGKGLDTPLYKVDEDGVEISGGEAQKIGIARAIYKDAPFIVLDEPTAALDPIAEFEIYSKFNQIVGSKTAIYISHRLSSCRFCDDIAVFHEGKIVQRGSHDKLVEDKAGKYHELWFAQAQYYSEKHMGETMLQNRDCPSEM